MSREDGSTTNGYPDSVQFALAHIGHPIRLLVLERAVRDVISPRGLAREHPQYTLGTISYHVRKLHDMQLLRLVRTTMVRGALAHHYRATKRAERLMDELAAAGQDERWRVLEAALEQVVGAARIGEARAIAQRALDAIHEQAPDAA